SGSNRARRHSRGVVHAKRRACEAETPTVEVVKDAVDQHACWKRRATVLARLLFLRTIRWPERALETAKRHTCETSFAAPQMQSDPVYERIWLEERATA